MIPPNQNDIKIYKINNAFYELNSFKNSKEKINFIIKYHVENFDTPYEVNKETTVKEYNGIQYTIYVFNEVERDSIWKKFFPKEMIGAFDFSIKSTSFAVFIEVNENIYCLIGGKGISVIKRFINHSFGIDLYEKIADPANDIVHTHSSRGLIGNLTSEFQTFKNEQKLEDTLSIGRIPNKLFLVLRQELKDSVFEFLDYAEDDLVYIEIGSSFCIRRRLSFKQTHQLIIRIDEIMVLSSSKSLSRFERVRDESFCREILKMALYDHVRDDMVRLNSGKLNRSQLLDFDLVHPSKLLKFYECSEYQVFVKNGKKPFYKTSNRASIYSETIKYIFNEIKPTDRWGFIQCIGGIRIEGYRGTKNETKAPFVNHITCEIPINNKPYFFIDNLWYQVQGDFIDSINNQCLSMMKNHMLGPNILHKTWPTESMTEDEYNKLYLHDVGYLVLDKMLGQNIELCDLLIETGGKTYLIHVKEEFNAKMRDLTNQVYISANRLWNELKAGSEKSFLKEVFKRYQNSGNNINNISEDIFFNYFNKDIQDIVYVVAFATSRNKSKVVDSISKHNSNIAKLSIIQSVREMQANFFPLNICEIENN